MHFNVFQGSRTNCGLGFVDYDNLEARLLPNRLRYFALPQLRDGDARLRNRQRRQHRQIWRCRLNSKHPMIVSFVIESPIIYVNGIVFTLYLIGFCFLSLIGVRLLMEVNCCKKHNSILINIDIKLIFKKSDFSCFSNSNDVPARCSQRDRI